MTQENKELLLKDLCARLPYGVKVDCKWKTPAPNNTYGMICTLDSFLLDQIYNVDDVDVPFDEFKPYLFPLSSMTEEQKRELRQMDAFVNTFGQICFSTYDDYMHELVPTFEDAIRITNWLNKNNFDYRGLIPKELAIDATGLNIY